MHGAQTSAQTILLVSGLSGAGKSTTLRALEDLGWEVVDNLPISLMRSLLASPPPLAADGNVQPLAVGIDSRTRGFNAEGIVRAIKRLRENSGHLVSTLFLDCHGVELERRFAETRRRHPLADDRPVADGVARERELLEPLRRWAEQLLDTSEFSAADLKAEIRRRFSLAQSGQMTLNIMSFGFSRGVPRNADLVFDMRFLRNPYWQESLREKTGRDHDVIEYITQDVAYSDSLADILSMLTRLLPRYQMTDRAYLTIAFGCTGGRHRSVHIAEYIAQHLRELGFSPHLTHRNLESAHNETLEGNAPAA
jgi:UPF0042 nucleotide-binding protein